MKKNKIIFCIALLAIFSILASLSYAKDADKINLNKATVEELSKVPGLNPDLAKKIIDARKENGEFVDMDELLDIDGIDVKLLRQLKKYLIIKSLDGCNC